MRLAAGVRDGGGWWLFRLSSVEKHNVRWIRDDSFASDSKRVGSPPIDRSVILGFTVAVHPAAAGVHHQRQGRGGCGLDPCRSKGSRLIEPGIRDANQISQILSPICEALSEKLWSRFVGCKVGVAASAACGSSCTHNASEAAPCFPIPRFVLGQPPPPCLSGCLPVDGLPIRPQIQVSNLLVSINGARR